MAECLLRDLGRDRFEVVYAARPKFDSHGNTTQAVELISVQSKGAAECLGMLKEPPSLIKRPCAFLKIGVAGNAWKLIGHGGKCFFDDAIDEVRLFGVDGMGAQECACHHGLGVLRGRMDGSEHFEFGFRCQAVPGLHLDRTGAERLQSSKSIEECFGQFLLCC